MQFTPKVHKTIRKFMSNVALIHQLIDAFGSPLNILFPEIAGENLDNFKAVLKDNHIRGRVYFAHKSNKSNCIPRYLSFQDAFIDVSSINELKSALTNGFIGSRIEATGLKTREFIILGIQHGIIFNVDNIQELNDIINITKETNIKKRIQILIRFSGFKSNKIKIINKDSRFGISFLDAPEVLQFIREHQEILDFLGVAFHLDTIEIKEKIIAVECSINILNTARELDLEPKVLNIGGGFKSNYLSDKNEWETSITLLKEAILNGENNYTWNNQSFGLYKDKGTLRGTLNVYSFYDEAAGSRYLEQILSTSLQTYQNRSIGTILHENMITLYIEPGKSLLADTGITISKVAFVKKSSKGEILVGLSMKKTDVVFEDQEIFVDPIILYKDENTETKHKDDKIGVFFVGNLCLETDFIYKHKIFINKIPAPGDIVIFVNTAGYFMDFSSSDTIKQRIATKLAVIQKENGFRWYLDENYVCF